MIEKVLEEYKNGETDKEQAMGGGFVIINRKWGRKIAKSLTETEFNKVRGRIKREEYYCDGTDNYRIYIPANNERMYIHYWSVYANAGEIFMCLTI